VSLKHLIIGDLIDLKKAFDHAGIPFFMQEGCALGIGREGDILAHDVDIDLGVATEVSPKQKRALYGKMMELGWKNLIDSTDFVFAARQVKLNIWFYHLEGEFYIAYPDSTPGQKAAWPKEFYDKLTARQDKKLLGPKSFTINSNGLHDMGTTSMFRTQLISI
jgi:hypothetical protein